MGYITYGPRGLMLEVRCKLGCAAVLRQRENVEHAFLPTPEYTELVIEMVDPNGGVSAHETGVCRACWTKYTADGGISAAELYTLYDEDVAQWKESARRLGTPQVTVEQLAAPLAARRPLRVVPDQTGRGQLHATRGLLGD
jgi:hypothetical protein